MHSPLRREREQRGWSQVRLARELGVTTKTVSRWEKGGNIPYPYYRERLCTLFGKNARELGLLPRETSPPAKRRVKPQKPAPREVSLAEAKLYDPAIPLGYEGILGRDALLTQIKRQLFNNHDLALTALNGLPGVGKTTMALALITDPEVQTHFSDGVLWTGLGPSPSVQSHLARWGSLLGVFSERLGDESSWAAWGLELRKAIGMRRMLLVIDDAWQIDDALAFRVGGPNCAYVLTTRLPQVAAHFAWDSILEVPELDETNSLELLAHFIPNLVRQEEQTARKLVRTVGGLPLALKLMGRYLASSEHTKQARRFQAALESLRDTRQRLQLHVPLPPREHTPSLPYGGPVSLQAAIEVSDRHLHPVTREVLYALAILPAKPYSFSEATALAVTEQPVEVLDELIDAGLLESSGPGRYTLHQTIVDYARLQGEQQKAQKQLISYAIQYSEARVGDYMALTNAPSRSSDYYALSEECFTLLCALEAAYTSQMRTELVRLACTLARFLYVSGFSEAAVLHLPRAYEAAVALSDERSQGYLLYHMGLVMQAQGEHEQARNYYLQGLELVRRVGNQELESVILGILALVETKFGRYWQAEAYGLEGLALARRIGNPRQICTVLTNLLGSAFLQGHFLDSAAYAKEALTILRQSGGSQRGLGLCLMLSSILQEAGDYEQSQRYSSEALELAKLRGDKVSMSNALANQAVNLAYLGDDGLAAVCGQHALELAAECPVVTWTGLNNLGIPPTFWKVGAACRIIGDYECAEKCLQQALKLAHGNELYVIPFMRIEQAELYLRQRRYAEAEAILREQLAQLSQGADYFIACAQFGLARIAAAQKELHGARELGAASLKHFTMLNSYLAQKVSAWLERLPD